MTRFFTDCSRCGANSLTGESADFEEFRLKAEKAGWFLDPLDSEKDRCPKCFEKEMEAAFALEAGVKRDA